ncbi:MAG: hypothetical protein ACTSWZ_00735 [Candidatus Heimdallarchaeaceae archaeon]
MVIKISREEWEEFQKWKKLKESQESKAEADELELVNDLVTEEVEEEKEEYICGNCGFVMDEPLSRCPNCNQELEWD